MTSQATTRVEIAQVGYFSVGLGCDLHPGPNNFAIKLDKWVGMAKKIGDNVEISLKYEKLRHFYP